MQIEINERISKSCVVHCVRTGKKRCDMSVQETEEETFLHICSFPPMNVLLYVATHLDVLECDTNTNLYKRTVFVEDHCETFPFHFFTILQRKEWFLQKEHLLQKWGKQVISGWATTTKPFQMCKKLTRRTGFILFL